MLGIASSESYRILRLAPTSQHQRHLESLKRNLLNRGFRAADVSRVFHRVRSRFIRKPGSKDSRPDRCHVFKILHSSGTRTAFLRRALYRYAHVLRGSCSISNDSIRLSKRLQRNQFLRTFSLTWRREAALERAGGLFFLKPHCTACLNVHSGAMFGSFVA